VSPVQAGANAGLCRGEIATSFGGLDASPYSLSSVNPALNLDKRMSRDIVIEAEIIGDMDKPE